MATYKFACQQSYNAFNFNDDVPSNQWRTMSRHTTYAAALRRQQREIAEMHEVLRTQTGWSHNFQIIALRDTQMRVTCICMGFDSYHWCPDDKAAIVKFSWPAGTPHPIVPPPDGWVSDHLCGACAAHGDAFLKTHPEY